MLSLQLTRAVTDGSRRVLTRTGGILFALLLAQQALVVTSLNTVLVAETAATESIGLTLPVSETVAGAVFVGVSLFNAVYFVVLARAFARPLAQLSSFPAELYTRRIVPASLTMLVAGLSVAVATLVGFVALFFPGVFLAACFLFVIFAVGVEDCGVIRALKRSWDLSRGHRLRLGVFVSVVGIGGALVGAVPAVLELAGEPAIGDVTTALSNSILFIFVYGIMASAYRQVTDASDGLGGTGTSAAAGTGSVLES